MPDEVGKESTLSSPPPIDPPKSPEPPLNPEPKLDDNTKSLVNPESPLDDGSKQIGENPEPFVPIQPEPQVVAGGTDSSVQAEAPGIVNTYGWQQEKAPDEAPVAQPEPEATPEVGVSEASESNVLNTTPAEITPTSETGGGLTSASSVATPDLGIPSVMPDSTVAPNVVPGSNVSPIPQDQRVVSTVEHKSTWEAIKSKLWPFGKHPSPATSVPLQPAQGGLIQPEPSKV